MLQESVVFTIVCHKNQKHQQKSGGMGGGQPEIAVVVPLYNEESNIERCFTSLVNQTLDSSKYALFFVDGGSTDKTKTLLHELIEKNGNSLPHVLVLDNPKRSVPHARNIALKHLPESVQFVVEHIGHGFVENRHLEQRLASWIECEKKYGPKLAGVGVKVISDGDVVNRRAQWIESALQSWLGQSGGQFARFSEVEITNTPAFVMHRREYLENIGGWDESFITSQDSELSMRLLRSGYILARSPSPTVMMKKRSTLLQWWKMGHRYGFWRTKVLKKYPSRVKFVELLPLLGLITTSFLFLLHQSSWVIPVLLYGLVMATDGVSQAVRTRNLSTLFGGPLCLFILHTSFSLGLIDGLFRKGRFSSDRR
jgi:succinoglycan biosynthesis protein ExoA